MSDTVAGGASSLSDKKKAALRALISSLAPNGLQGGPLNGNDAGELTGKLQEILGVSDVPEGRRNGRGELLNEEGLPIIDITEPVNDSMTSSQNPEAFISEENSVPFHALSEQEKLRLRAEENRMLDLLEEEEERMEGLARERELAEENARRQAEDKAERERKLAAREMQKKLGKALLRNIAEQREKEEKQERDRLEKDYNNPTGGSSSQPCNSTNKKPKKSVSFADLPEASEKKHRSKPHLAWGDVSIASLKQGFPRARLKADVMMKQPMKLEVTERTPGKPLCPTPPERDSDDESNPEEIHDFEYLENDHDDVTPPLDGDFDDSDMSSRPDDDSDSEGFDISQAALQREMALEYIRLRESIGADAHDAMTAHSHKGKDAWDQPEVPLETTLASRPPKSGISRFKAERQGNITTHASESYSLGASVLPQEKSSQLRTAVRLGKLTDDQLVGGEEADSASEGENTEEYKRSIELLKAGLVVDDASERADEPESENTSNSTFKPEVTSSRQEVMAPAMSSEASGSAPSPAASRTLAQKVAHRNIVNAGGPSASNLSLSASVTVSEGKPMEVEISKLDSSHNSEPSKQESSTTSLLTSTFKKPPTVIQPPGSSLLQQNRLYAVPQVPPDPAVLSNMIVDSPSFPPPGSAPQQGQRASPIASEVRESNRKAGMTEMPVSSITATARTGRVSRFKAERSL